MGVIVGGRLGYCLFYKPGYYLSHPLEIFFVWQGGMSFHGGLLGVIASMVWFARSRVRPFWQVMDFVAPCVPTGLAAGRVGNFINGELWGRFSSPDLPWGMVFPQSGSMLPRHPSQVYQFLLEGLLLFVLLWLYARKERRERRVSAVFLIGYGVMRFIAEYFREPDDFLGLLALGMSMGQWLCVPMILAGIWLYVSAPPRRAQTCPPLLRRMLEPAADHPTMSKRPSSMNASDWITRSVSRLRRHEADASRKPPSTATHAADHCRPKRPPWPSGSRPPCAGRAKRCRRARCAARWPNCRRWSIRA